MKQITRALNTIKSPINPIKSPLNHHKITMKSIETTMKSYGFPISISPISIPIPSPPVLRHTAPGCTSVLRGPEVVETSPRRVLATCRDSWMFRGDLLGFCNDFMGFYSDLLGFYCVLPGFHRIWWNLMGCFMGFKGISCHFMDTSWGFNGYLMGIIYGNMYIYIYIYHGI